MFYRRKFDKLLVVLLAAGIFLYASIRSVFRIRPDMPQQFVDMHSRPGHDPRVEQETARAYWNCVVTDIQWKYGYAYHLPQTPPPEFSIPLTGAPDDQTRARYWNKLQEVWYVPGTWTRQYEWDFSWLNNPLAAAGNWWEQEVRRISPR